MRIYIVQCIVDVTVEVNKDFKIGEYKQQTTNERRKRSGSRCCARARQICAFVVRCSTAHDDGFRGVSRTHQNVSKICCFLMYLVVFSLKKPFYVKCVFM